MRALIFEGQIVDLAAADFPVHESMQWVDAPAGATMETHVFSGGAVVQKPPKTQAELEAENNAAALAELRAIDAASVRGLREWVASQPGAPAVLVQHEQAAQAARARLKP